jgi:hypothetical protein
MVGWWGITAHATHLLLAAALVVLLALFAAFERRPFMRSAPTLCGIAAVLALAVLAPVALNTYLDGKPSLDGQRPPYLTARIVADGPGRWYLESHCATEHWAVCGHLANVSNDADSFLWGDNSPYDSATEDQKRLYEAQDVPLVLAAVRAYPREELQMAAARFWQQLFAFGLYDFDSSPWTIAQFNEVIPASRASYLRSREAHGELPLDALTRLQLWTVRFSLVVSIGFALLSGRIYSRRLLGLALVVGSMVVLNALLTGVLSIVDDRYQCRVIWLIPLLAGVSLIEWWERRRDGQHHAAAHGSQSDCKPACLRAKSSASNYVGFSRQ